MDEIIEIESDTEDVECTSININDNKHDDNNSECSKPDSCVEDANGSYDQSFPTWLENFNKKCLDIVGTKCLKQLDLLLDDFLVNLRREYEYCSRSPKRSWYVAQQTYKFLIFFYMYYEDAKDFFITSHWTEHIIELLVIYCKLEIKSSIRVFRGKENDDMIATRIMNLMCITLENDETHMIHILLKIVRDKCFAHRQRDIFSPIFRKLLSTKRARDLTDLEYVRLILAFKSWKRLLQKNEKKEISKLCQNIVKQPKGFDKNYKKYRFLPPVPNNLSSHEFLITTMFDLPQIVQNYFLFIESKKNKPLDSSEQINKQISLSTDLYTNFATEEDLTEDFLESCLPLLNSIKEETDKVCPSKAKNCEPKVAPTVIEFIDLTDEAVNEPIWAQNLVEIAQNYTQELIEKHMTEISLKDNKFKPKLVEKELVKSLKVDIQVDSTDKIDKNVDKLPISSIEISSNQDVTSSNFKDLDSPSSSRRPSLELEENNSNDSPDSSEQLNMAKHLDTSSNSSKIPVNIPKKSLEVAQNVLENTKINSNVNIIDNDIDTIKNNTSKVSKMEVEIPKSTSQSQEVSKYLSEVPKSDDKIVIPTPTAEIKCAEVHIPQLPQINSEIDAEKVISLCHNDKIVIQTSDVTKNGDEQEFVDNLFSSELTPKKFQPKEIKISNIRDDNRINTRSRRSKHVQFTIKEPRDYKSGSTGQNFDISTVTTDDTLKSDQKEGRLNSRIEITEENVTSPCSSSKEVPESRITNNITTGDISYKTEKHHETQTNPILVHHTDKKRSKKSVAESLFDQLKSSDDSGNSTPKSQHSAKNHSKTGNTFDVISIEKDKDVRKCKVEISRLKIDGNTLKAKKSDSDTVVIPKKSVIKTDFSYHKEKKKVRFSDSNDNSSKIRKNECIAKVYKHSSDTNETSGYHQKSDEVIKHRKDRGKSYKGSRKRHRRNSLESASKTSVVFCDTIVQDEEITSNETETSDNTYDQAYNELNDLVNHQNLDDTEVEICENITSNLHGQPVVSYSDFEQFVEQTLTNQSDTKVTEGETSTDANLKTDFSDLKSGEIVQETSEYCISNIMSYRDKRKSEYVAYKSSKITKPTNTFEEKSKSVRTYSNNRPKIGSYEKYLISNFGFDTNDLRKLDIRVCLENVPYQKMVDEAFSTPKMPKRLSNIDFNVDLKREMINSSKIQSSPTIIERQDYMKSKNNEVLRARVEKRPGFENHHMVIPQKGVKRKRKNEESRMKNEERKNKKTKKNSTKGRRKNMGKSSAGLASFSEDWQYQTDQVQQQPWRFG